MRLKKLGIALLAVVALSAIAVGSASAAATTTAAEVYTGASPGTTLAAGTSEAATFTLSGSAVLKSKVGTKETPIELTATGASCSGCKLENKAVTSKTGNVAFGTGKILFTGVTVSTPANCKVVSEAAVEKQVITKTVNVHADFMNGSVATQQFVPASGTSFAAFELENNGGTCAVAGLYNVTGTLFTDATNATGTFAKSQPATTNPTIQAADGGKLSIGSQEAQLFASGSFALGSGKEWAIK
jgi:hypothetical protein